MRRARFVFLLVTAAIVTSGIACGSSFGADDPPPPTTNDASPEGATSGEAAPPPEAGEAAPPPGMVRVDGPSSFYIDEAEVTVADYGAFAPTSPPFESEPRCAWKASPRLGCPATSSSLPVTCIDWCDALFYCESVGKRLCGRIGGGTLTGGFAIAAQSQWLWACAGSAATNRYAYGSVYEPGRCNSDDGGLESVKIKPLCTGSVDGLFDLSGNVKEWEDGCVDLDGGPDAARNSSCVIRGGSFTGPPSASTCSHNDLVSRHDSYADVGFRCCKDL